MTKTLFTGLCLMLSLPGLSQAAVLLDHPAFNLLIIADEVNPHGLTDAQLTQPEDLAPALSSTGSPLNLSGVASVSSQCIDDALTALSSESPPDVVLYFAHRGAAQCDGSNAQPTLTAMLASGLQQGMGLVVLHHGLYVDFTNRGIKQDLLNIIGAQSDSIQWNTDSGQRVINVGANHFITRNGVTYSGQHAFSGMPGIAAGTYPAFTNVPDELYEVTTLNTEPGESRTPLFASDSGTNRLLGYVLEREGWRGRVITWQPGEYQPAALDDQEGNNFQILVNAIYYAAHGE